MSEIEWKQENLKRTINTKILRKEGILSHIIDVNNSL